MRAENSISWRDVARFAVGLILALSAFFLKGVDSRLRTLELSVAKMESRLDNSVENVEIQRSDKVIAKSN